MMKCARFFSAAVSEMSGRSRQVGSASQTTDDGNGTRIKGKRNPSRFRALIYCDMHNRGSCKLNLK